MISPFVAGLGTTELLIILAVLILLFGAAKLPELARGSGRALRIFKAETKGLMDDDDKNGVQDDTSGTTPPQPRGELRATQIEPQIEPQIDPQTDPDAEAERRRRGDTTI